MNDRSIIHRLTARNTARESPNKIHDESVAKQYGFSGGLVPGVTIFAWMCGPPLDAFGEKWLSGGAISARFREPVYEGDRVTISGRLDADEVALKVATCAGGAPRATGRATPASDGTAPDPSEWVRHAVPASPPPATVDSLMPGRMLGTLDAVFHSDAVAAYLASIGADHPVTAAARVAHPGWLLVFANLGLSTNVELGPWIHVSSDMHLHDAVREGEQVSTFTRVEEEFERKGHRFVSLDVLITAGGRPAATVRHVAIYAPRRPA